MSSDRERRIFDLLRAALDLPAAERGDFLEERCGEDRALLADVRAALEDATDVGGLPEPPALEALYVHSLIGRWIEDFRLERLVATGGMGAVFEATQRAPRRRVALKVMRPDRLGDAETRRRFEREIRLLAELDHPHVARILRAGTHALGDADVGAEIPWFAMELVVGGLPITAFAHARELDLDSRLALFADVCAAVGHGHERGVVHRDLKPSNVLVDAAGAVKVIDLGVARAAGAREEGTGLRTATGAWVGTVDYMSPEQVDATFGAVTERSDVYALGVLLYELATGERPYELAGVSPAEVARTICHSRPPRPGRADPRCGGDLESVILRALEKDPAVRYATAGELGSDVRRVRELAPVNWRRPGRLYRLRKLAERHPVAALLAVLLLAVGAVGGMASAVLYAHAESAAARSRHLAGRLGHIDAVRSELEAAIDELMGEVAARAVYAEEDEGSALGRMRLASRPRVRDAAEERRIARLQARLQVLIADFDVEVEPGELRPEDARRLRDAELAPLLAEELYEDVLARLPDEALAEELRALDDARERAAERLRYRGDALRGLARWEEALACYRELVQRRPDDLAGYRRCAGVLERLRRHAECAAVLTAVAERFPENAEVYFDRAIQWVRCGRLEDALADGERAVGLRPQFSEAYQNLGVALFELGRPREALACFETALVQGGDDPLVLLSLADTLSRLGSVEAAIEAYRRTLELDPGEAAAYSGLAIALGRAGRCDEARGAAARAVELACDSPLGHYNRGIALNWCGSDEALGAFETAVLLSPRFAEAHREKAARLARLGRDDEALEAIDAACAIREVAGWRYDRSVILAKLGRSEEAIEENERAIDLGLAGPQLVQAWSNLASLCGMLARYEEAVAAADRAIELAPRNLNAYQVRGGALGELGRLEEALETFDRALAIRPDHEQIRRARGWYALRAGTATRAPGPPDPSGGQDR